MSLDDVSKMTIMRDIRFILQSREFPTKRDEEIFKNVSIAFIIIDISAPTDF